MPQQTSTEVIPFFNGQQSSWSELSGAAPAVHNVVVDGRGTLRRRPAIVAYGEAPTTAIDSDGVIGLHGTNGGKLYAVGGSASVRKMYRIANGSAVQLGGTATEFLLGNERPTFAETEALLVVAGGDAPQKILLDTHASSRLGGSPPNATHVVINRLRLSANDASVDRSKVRYSDIAQGSVYSGHESWTFGGIGISGFYSAEARSDPVVAIGETTDEVFVFGQTSVQVFAADPSIVYAPVSTREYGCSAPYSVVRFDERFAWIDHRKRFIISDGRSQEDITQGLEKTIQAMTVSDAFGFRVYSDFVDALVWVFPSEGRTFAWQRGIGWDQWQGFDQTSNNWKALPITAHARRPDDGTEVVGLSDGRVAKLAMDEAEDLGEPVLAYVESGFQDRNTALRKHCLHVRITLERGNTTASSEPLGWLSWADSQGAWVGRRAIGFGLAGDRRPVVELDSLGVYRTRNWRFEFSGAANLALVRIEEEFEVLDR